MISENVNRKAEKNVQVEVDSTELGLKPSMEKVIKISPRGRKLRGKIFQIIYEIWIGERKH